MKRLSVILKEQLDTLELEYTIKLSYGLDKKDCIEAIQSIRAQLEYLEANGS